MREGHSPPPPNTETSLRLHSHQNLSCRKTGVDCPRFIDNDTATELSTPLLRQHNCWCECGITQQTSVLVPPKLEANPLRIHCMYNHIIETIYDPFMTGETISKVATLSIVGLFNHSKITDHLCI